jgi:hypothetical protein
MGPRELSNEAASYQATKETCQCGRTFHLFHMSGQEVPCSHRLFRGAEKSYSQGEAVLVMEKVATPLIIATIGGTCVIDERVRLAE